jgi:hypothetical protein
MSTSTAFRESNGGLAARLASPPGLGLLIFTTILLYKPIAHSLLVLQHHFFTGNSRYLVGATVGLLGFTLVGKGLRRDELTASAMGYMGGALVWMGWFEYAFDFFGGAMGIDPLIDPVTGSQVLPGNLLLIEATAVPFVAMMILFGANRETRCRLLMWFQRNLRLAPEKPTPGYKRNYAWVTAWETIFITWAFYIQIILLYDVRIAGKDHWATYAAFCVYGIWGVYLFTKLVKHAEPGAAIRYAIPTTNVFWIMIEMGSHWHWFEEIWIKPLQYPISTLAFMAAFAAGAVAVLAPRGGPNMRVQAAE